MGRIRAAIILTVLLTGICICALWITHHVCDQMHERVDEISQLTYKGESEQLRKLIDDTEDYWEKNEKILQIYCYHNELEDVAKAVFILGELYAENDMALIRLECGNARIALEHLLANEDPTISSIL